MLVQTVILPPALCRVSSLGVSRTRRFRSKYLRCALENRVWGRNQWPLHQCSSKLVILPTSTCSQRNLPTAESNIRQVVLQLHIAACKLALAMALFLCPFVSQRWLPTSIEDWPQVRIQVLRFGGAEYILRGGNYVWNNFFGVKQNLGATAPECPTWMWAWLTSWLQTIIIRTDQRIIDTRYEVVVSGKQLYFVVCQSLCFVQGCCEKR